MRNRLFYASLTVFGLILCAGVVAFLSVRLYSVPNAFMEPTLFEGDSLLEIRNFGFGRVQRGELAAFHLPNDSAQIAVRRVVGLPGDRIRVHAGRLVLNGQQLAEPYIKISKTALGADFPSSMASMLGIGGELRILLTTMYAEWVKNGTLTVPQGYFFMLGDNRTNTVDSRNFGLVPEGNLVARPVYVYQTDKPAKARRILDSYIIGDPP